MSDRKRRGFSLLEVLVAFVVLALSLSTLLPALTGLNHRNRSIENRWLAGELALSRLDMAGVTSPLAASVDSGTWRNWIWRLEVRPLRTTLVEGNRFAAFYEVAVDVTDGSSGEVLARLVTVKRDRKTAR